MEENQEPSNETVQANVQSNGMERRQISIPLVGGILIIIVGVLIFVSALKLLVFNDKKEVNVQPVNANETAEIVVDTPQIQY